MVYLLFSGLEDVRPIGGPVTYKGLGARDGHREAEGSAGIGVADDGDGVAGLR
jgi:hypothetical protein